MPAVCCKIRMLLVLILVLLSPAVFGQDCPELQDSDLGDTDAPATTGLLSSALAAVSGDITSNMIQILASNQVCLGQGAMRNRYRTVSLVVRYFRASDSTNVTVQVEYECTNGVWGFGSQPSVTNDPQATLTVALRTDCILCVSPALAPVTVTIEEHCAVCDSCDPDGLMRCTGEFSSQTCCNYFDMSGNCVVICPANSAPNAINVERECECDAGYATSGNVCQEINECDSSPCENGGTCTDMINAFTCACPPDFTGITCTTDVNECDPNPCANGGACTDGTSAFTCSCASGFTDVTCMTNIDECDPNPCGNGGTCADGINAFSCDCAPNFTGDNCTKCDGGRRLTQDNECEDSPNNTPVIVGVVVAILVIAILVILALVAIVIVIVKKKKAKVSTGMTDTSEKMEL